MQLVHSHTPLPAPRVVLEEEIMFSLQSFIFKEQNDEQCLISASGLHCLTAATAMGTPQEWKQVPQAGGDREMEM